MSEQTERFDIRLRPGDRKKLERLAKRHDAQMSQVIRAAIRWLYAAGPAAERIIEDGR